MLNGTSNVKRRVDASRTLLFLTLAIGFGQAHGVPVVGQVSGALNHKATITILGNGFGAKTPAAPLVWDDATGSTILQKWDGAWPDRIPPYNTIYHDPMRGIEPPHGHDTRYIAGAHAATGGADAGYNVIVFKNITLRPFPFHIYASWYQRADDAWVFGPNNNFKTFAYSVCCSPYEMPNDWFTVYGPPEPSSRASQPQWIYTDDSSSSLMNPDMNGHNAWWKGAVNPMAGRWSKVEVAVKVTNATDGYLRVWENGRQVMDYAGPTDRFPGSKRTIGVGGWSLVKNPNNWRYYADVYLDTTLSRVILADKPVLSQATIIEPQIPSAWSDGSITATVNLGKFSQGQTAYVFVVDSSGTANASGAAVTAGTAAVSPSPPASVAVH